MFFIPYGSYSISLSVISFRDEPCGNCKEKHVLQAVKYADVFHFCYVPIFFSTNIEIQCTNCSELVDLHEIDDRRHKKYTSLIPYKFPPIWLYSLPLILLFAAGYFFFNSNSAKNEMTKRLVETPLSRVLEYEMEEDTYSAIKIIAVTDHSYLYFQNNLSIEDEDFISKILEEKYFTKDTLELKMGVFKKWIDEGKIISVHY